MNFKEQLARPDNELAKEIELAQEQQRKDFFGERPLQAYSTRALKEELKLRKKEGALKARGK